MDKVLCRFFAKVKVMESGCWEWTASRDRYGYGEFCLLGKNWRAHRASLILHGHEIPDGMVVDHKCRNRACVNPKHLRVVDNRTNVMENSGSPAYLNSIKTHCYRGHELAGDNVVVHLGRYRRCVTCHRQSMRERWHQKWKLVRQAKKAQLEEGAVATATRPSKGFLKGESPQATWPFAQDDKGTK